MSAAKDRISALRALVAGAQSRTEVHNFNDVDQELQEVGWSNNASPERRKHLLQVFHGMRALESALKEVVRSYDVSPKNSLGDLLRQLNKDFPPNHPAHLDTGSMKRFWRSIRHDRNRLMHQANKFPRSSREADSIFGEIATCFSLLVK
jgi:hypothetical protein